MAVFKLYRGLEAGLPSAKTDGVAYFCKDTGNYYIDFMLDGTLTRSKISAKYADMLRYKSGDATIEVDPSTILTDGNYATKIGLATNAKAGLMSADHVTKLEGVEDGANKTIVEDNLTSTSTTAALSAAQGKLLDEKIKAINTNMEDLGAGDMLKSTYDVNGDGVVDNAEKLGGQLPSYYVTQNELDSVTGTLGPLVDSVGQNIDAAKEDGSVYARIAHLKENKADKATTLAGYGIGDAYTKTETDTAISTAVANAEYIPTSQKGAASGVAELDENGKVPSTQLPSYVDDVLEYANKDAFPAEGESGKIYVVLDNNLTYRWGGSAYVEISQSLAIGTTATTAAAGNHGHEAASQGAAGFMSAADKAKLDAIAEGATNVVVDAALSDSSENAIQNKVVKAALDGKSDAGHEHTQYENQNAFSVIKIGAATVEADAVTDTVEFEAGANVTITPDAANGKIVIAAVDTTYGEAATDAAGLMSAADKSKLDGVAAGAQVNVIESITSDSLTVGAVSDKNVHLDIEWVEF